MNDNENIVSIDAKLKEKAEETAEMETLKEEKEHCQEVIDRVKELNPINLLVIGVNEEEQFFIVESTKNPANVSYLTDIAKSMMMRV
jgi:hypothetical protein